MKKIENARNNFWGPCQVLNIDIYIGTDILAIFDPFCSAKCDRYQTDGDYLDLTF